MTEVMKNAAAHQYEMRVGDHIALVQFRGEADGTVRLLHTEDPVALEGQGIGSRLARGVLDSIRTEGHKVVPQCSFITDYIYRHPEYQDLVVPQI
jgi:predicted GNAT family acetyltransferase